MASAAAFLAAGPADAQLATHPTAVNVAPGLRFHWSLDEGPDWHDAPFQSRCSETVAHDLVGGNHARLVGMDASAWISGRQFSGLRFDGSDDFLSLSNAIIFLSGSSTFSCWFRTKMIGNDSFEAPALFGHVDEHGMGATWGAIDSQGRIGFMVNGSWLVKSRNPVNDSRWHHLLITRNHQSGVVALALDGEETVSTASAPIQAMPGSFSVQSIASVKHGVKTVFYAGDLDQIHLFNHVVDAEIRQQLLANHAPKAWPKLSVGTQDKSFDLECILFNVYDPDQDSVSVLSHTAPAHGTLAEVEPGQFRYTPKTGFTGDDQFEIVLGDGRQGYYRTAVPIRVEPALPLGNQKRILTFTRFQPAPSEGDFPAYSNFRVPRVVDWNQDGKLDLLVAHGASLWLHLNVGTKNLPKIGSAQAVPLGQPFPKGNMAIAIADLNGDGKPDLLVNPSDRVIKWYANTAAPGAPVTLAAPVPLATDKEQNLVLSDLRFDAGDFDGDGKIDLVTGTGAETLYFFKNVGSSTVPKFASPSKLFSGSYNIYPRVIDLDRNGIPDLVWGVNWGSVHRTVAAAAELKGTSGELQIEDSDGNPAKIRNVSDGAIVDFADLNGDGILDLIMGGHAVGGIYLAYGKVSTTQGILQELDQLYTANAANLGEALERDDRKQLKKVKSLYQGLVAQFNGSPIEERADIFRNLADHIKKHSFLGMAQPLDVKRYHHVPAIAGQNLVILHNLLPDTAAHRRTVADIVKLAGLQREIYLSFGLHIGDNQKCSRGQLESFRDFLSQHPRELFPDDMMMLDNYDLDGSAALVWVPNSCKNTFSVPVGKAANEWAGDLTKAIEAVKGTGSASGDYFTMVYCHEALHSLDHYINTRKNTDLYRRWGQTLSLAAGSDCITGANGWIDWKATETHFINQKLWDPSVQEWENAWRTYWYDSPAGKLRRKFSFMRGNTSWFLTNTQESLATQANQYFMDTEGRLIGAMDRARNGYPENLTEVITYLEFLSAGLNKIVFYDIDSEQIPYPRAVFKSRCAWLVRNDQGYITEIHLPEKRYRVTSNDHGVVTKIEATQRVGNL